MVFTPAAVPHIVARERLLHREVVQTIVDRDAVRIPHLKPSRLVLNNDCRPLNPLNVCFGLVPPVRHKDQITITHLRDHVLQLRAIILISEITVVLMLSLA